MAQKYQIIWGMYNRDRGKYMGKVRHRIYKDHLRFKAISKEAEVKINDRTDE